MFNRKKAIPDTGILTYSLRGLAYSHFSTSYAELYSYRTENRVQVISDRIDSLAAAAEQMSATIQEMAASIQSANHEQQQVSGHVDNGRQTLNRAMSAIAGAEQAISRLAGTVHELSGRVENINRAIGVISEITEQTQLLALNASIEAARAGETGRGFAVVAAEIRNLAQRTRLSAGEIKEAVDTLQKGMQETARAMEQSLQSVMTGLQAAREIEQPMNSIESGTTTLTGILTNLAAASQEQAAVTEEMAANASSVAETAHFAGELDKEATDHTNLSRQVLGVSWDYLATRLDTGRAGLPGFLAGRVVDHARWISRVLAVLRGKTESSADLTDHHACQFGRWYHNEGRREMEQLDQASREIYAAIDEPHRRVHQCGLAALESHRAGQDDSVYGHISCLTEASRQIIDLLMQLIDSVIAANNGSMRQTAAN